MTDSILRKTLVIKILVLLVAACVLGVLAEVVFNIKALRAGDKDTIVSDEYIFTENATLVDGEYIVDEEAEYALIALRMPQEYVYKLSYSYKKLQEFSASIRIYPEAGNINNVIEISDTNTRGVQTSYIKIDSKVEHIDIVLPAECKGMAFDDFTYVNSFTFSFRRFLTIATLVGLVLFFVMFGELVEKKVEYAFLIAGLTIGSVMCISFPLQKESWDEAYHFKQAYNMAIGDAVVTPEIAYYSNDNAVSKLLYPKTDSEYNQMTDYMNDINIYDKKDADNTLVRKGFAHLNDIGHIPSAVGMNIARILHLPFGIVYIMGKLLNMLFYVIVTFFAVKHITVGKKLMAYVALMPTPMFLACTYSYDATLNACAFLALSYIITEIVDDKKCISWKNYLIFMISTGIACAIKMVYAPMILLLLLLSNDKFMNKKTKIIMKYGVFILCAIGIIIMMGPLVMKIVHGITTGGGDSRGGATSDAGQLSLVLANPIAYAKLLLTNIINSFVDFSVGNGIFGWYAHFGHFIYGEFIILASTFVVITDTDEKTLKPFHKIFIAVLFLIMVCFVWSAMYISFTPVGANYIAGVQGRYFIPIIMLLFLCVNTSNIKNNIPKRIYNTLVLSMPIIFNYLMMGYLALTRCV